MFNRWQEETMQTRRRRVEAPWFYILLGVVLGSACWLTFIAWTLVMALTGH